MKFSISAKGESINSLIRRLGYIPQPARDNGEVSFYRPLTRAEYPHFHIYATKNEQTGELIFNLHLDQKKPSYGEFTAHSGEYDGKLVEEEAERIKTITATPERRGDAEDF